MRKGKLMSLISIILSILLLVSCKKSDTKGYTRSDSAKNSNMGTVRQESKDMSGIPAPAFPQTNTEEYKSLPENSIQDVIRSPLSTFSIDVDTASYSNVRRFLTEGTLPPKDSVRIEELVNYFSYEYPEPENNVPFSITTEVSTCPWNNAHYLAMIGIQGKRVSTEDLPPSNLVFLLDVSGSMNEPNKLPLVKSAMKLLINNLNEKDKISIVVYAGAAGVVLEPTPGSNKDKITAAIDKLSAGGSTAGGQGIQLAYKLARDNFIKGGNNRVILATDGDFNVGISSESELVKLIEERRKDNIFLSVLGFGQGNLKDSKMEALADKGNGNYAYIDTLLEAKKVLVEQMGSTLLTIAKDVKIQVEFNPAKIKGYRLVGYENRKLNNEDFNDDKKDAGELGAGHTVTAFYELIPANSKEKIANIDDLKYQQLVVTNSEDLMTLKLRYKTPTGNTSELIECPVKEKNITKEPSSNFRFASSVAEFGLLLTDSEYRGNSSFDHVLKTARASRGEDLSGYRSEFTHLVELAQNLKR